LRVASLEADYQATFGHSQFMDDRALLALQVNGTDLSPDHGYPARLVVPNVPGTHNIKWVSELRFEAA
jgi:DMSO/TMAO reductase YedYZ molybdopterin-dependent catalytic subunit